MLIDQPRFLILFSRVAYVVELVANKKPHNFVIHSLRKISGEYIAGQSLVAENVLKLWNKVDDGEYTLLLPDSLCINVMVKVESQDDKMVTAHIEEHILPGLGITDASHQVKTQTISQFRGTSQVQVSALSNELLAPVRAASAQTEVHISSVVGISWALKGLVSLEPSLTILEADGQLHLAKHYIGVDATASFGVDEIDAIVEAITTEKEQDGNIQTIYALTTKATADAIEEELGDSVPIQLVMPESDPDAQLAAHTERFLTEAGRTLSIGEYPIPEYKLTEASDAEISEFNLASIIHANAQAAATSVSVENTDEPTEPELEPEIEEDSVLEVEPEFEPEITEEPEPESEAELELKDESSELDAETDLDDNQLHADQEIANEMSIVDERDLAEDSELDPPTEESTSSVIDLTKFAVAGTTNNVPNTGSTKPIHKPGITNSATLAPPAKKPVIKNKAGAHHMVQMILFTSLAFLITVTTGVLISLGLINMTTGRPIFEPPVYFFGGEAEPAPTPMPTPEPVTESEAPEIEEPEVDPVDPSELSVLIVNATARAGYAGTVAETLEGFESVRAANAQGTYEDPGIYIGMVEPSPALLDLISEQTELEVSELSSILETEDAAGTYDVVIVLAE
jgi:hypothetical protein